MHSFINKKSCIEIETSYESSENQYQVPLVPGLKALNRSVAQPRAGQAPQHRRWANADRAENTPGDMIDICIRIA